VNGFVVETPFAGGHNAPPRGKVELNSIGEPIYGARDEVDLNAMRELKVPFWMAGSYGSAAGLKKAQSEGAHGIQVGTAFALSEESGLSDSYKKAMIAKAVQGDLKVFTDPMASPTGFPFKIAELEGTLSDPELYRQRPRNCDLGYLRQLYKKEDGTLGYRCPSEPTNAYVKKGGKVEDTKDRKCLCNALLANIGLEQQSKDYLEKPLITLGNDFQQIATWIKPNRFSYSASDVISSILQA
jgi:nitronate monooxygenase